MTCPYCKAGLGVRTRDEQGSVWHDMPNGVSRLPCYERNRATPAEIAEELDNKAREDRYAGRV